MKTTAPYWTKRSSRAVVNPWLVSWTVLFWLFAFAIGVLAIVVGEFFAQSLGANHLNASAQSLAFFWIGVVPMLMWTAVIKYLHTRTFASDEAMANREVIHALYFAMPPLLIVACQPIFAHTMLATNNIAATAVPLGAAFVTFAGWFALGELNVLANASAAQPRYIGARAR